MTQPSSAAPPHGGAEPGAPGDGPSETSLASYRLLFEHNPLPMWVVDLETLAFLAVNDAALRQYGYERAEFLALKLTDIRPPDEVPALLAKVQRVTAERTGFDEAGIWRHRRKDGTLFDADVTSHAITFAGRPARLVLARDVTAERQIAAALRRREEQLRFTLEATGVGTWEWEVETGRITWSDNVAAVLGHPPERFDGTLPGFLSLIHPDDRAWLAEAVRRAVDDGADYDVEFRVVDAAGAIRWIAARGGVIGEGASRRMLGTAIDVTARKRDEETLRHSERRSRTVIDQSPLSKQILAPDGTTLQVNRAWERLFGVRPADIEGYNILRDPQLEANGVLPLLRRAFAGEVVAIPPTDYVPDRGHYAGRPISVRAFAYPVKDDAGQVREVVVVHEDVTDRQRAERRLELYREVIARANDAIAIIDPTGAYLEQNDAHRALLGYSDDELVGHTPALHFGAEAFGRIAEELARTGRYRGELVSRTKDGRRVDIDLSAFAVRSPDGAVSHYVGIKRDVSERKRIEQRLREETETLELVNRVGRLLTSELDLHRLVQTVTDAATELTGASLGAFFSNAVDEQGEHYLLDTLSGAPRERFAGLPMPRSTAMFGETFSGRAVVRLADVRLDPRFGRNPPFFGFPEGHPPVVSYLAVPVVSRSGEVLGGLFFGHERAGVFTERAEQLAVGLAAQAAVAMDNARLFREAQDAIRARDEFLSIAAHELRTPVAGIRGYAQLLHRAIDRGRIDPDRLAKAVDAVLTASDRMITLTNDLLDVSRIRLGQLPLRRQSVDLLALVGRLVEHYRDQFGPDHALALDAPAALPSVTGDPDRLEQIVVNLLENAAKYSPDGGPIAVRLRQEAGSARLEVVDRGIGLPPGAAETIFEPFGRAPNAQALNLPGLGLGLYVCRNIVERHGGRIWADSPGEGRGTTFVVTLPIDPSDEGAGDPSVLPP